MSFLLSHRPLLYGSVPALAILCFLAYAWWRSAPGDRYAAHHPDVGRRVREHPAAARRPDDPWQSDAPIRPASAWSGAVAPGGTQLRAEITQLDARLDELAKAFGSGLEGVNRRLEGIARQLEVVLDPTRGGGSPRTYDDATRFDATTIGWNDAASLGAATVVSQPVGGYAGSAGTGLDAPAGNRVPVEIQGSEVALTHTIPPDAWLVAQGNGRASVWLNAEVEHNRYALDRFALFFELGDRREGAYVTRTPADVHWDEGGQRGRLRTAGKAVPR